MKNFKSLISLVISILFVAAIDTSAQNILTVTEKDRDGKYLKKDQTVKDGYVDNKIADINSVLDIRLDKTALESKIAEMNLEHLPDDLSKKIGFLSMALEKRNQTLRNLAVILEKYDYEKFKTDTMSYKAFIFDLQQEASVVYEIERIDGRISEEAENYEDPDEMFSGVYDAAVIVLEEMKSEIEDFARKEGFKIQFGGWLITKNQNIAVHLQGYDDIAPQAPYEVERWQFIPTKEQQEDFKNIMELAAENKELGTEIIRAAAMAQLEALKMFGHEKLKELLERIEIETQKIRDEFEGHLDPRLFQIIDELILLQADIRAFLKEMETRAKYYQEIISLRDFQLASFLEHAKTDIRFLGEEEGLRIKNKMEALARQINELGPAMLDSIAGLKMAYEGMMQGYVSEFRSVEALVKKKASEFLKGRELDMAALEFSSEVYKHTLDELPVSTELDLINTGARTDGDRIVLKMTLTDAKSPKQEALETRELYLFRVLPHVITTVGVIFADPLANTAIQTQFQMAPAFNFLFKGLGDQRCRRKSVAYNRLFDWGIGLHVAAPDFDKDDVPEISAGVVVSSLHDYLQGGFAFNLFTGDPYWFFGMRFPIPTFNIGASSQARIE